MKSGIPFDVAFSLPDDERFEWAVAMVESDGVWTYDHATGEWGKNGG